MSPQKHFKQTGHAIEMRNYIDNARCIVCELSWDNQKTFGTPLEPIMRAIYKYKYPDSHAAIYTDRRHQTDVIARFEEFKKKFQNALTKMVENIARAMGGASPGGLVDSAHGDAEYLLAFDEVILPVTRAFEPDIILVSCGFDAAKGDPLGRYELSPNGYAHMTRRLQAAVPSAKGRVVVCLEGGYNLDAISHSSAAIFRALLGHDVPDLVTAAPKAKAVETVAHVKAIHEAAGLLQGGAAPVEAPQQKKNAACVAQTARKNAAKVAPAGAAMRAKGRYPGNTASGSRQKRGASNPNRSSAARGGRTSKPNAKQIAN
jgi:hypothetical protein